MLGVFASFAAFERDLIIERTKAGLAAAQASGGQLGRPSAVHPQQVAHIHQLHAQGKSHRTIATLTGLSRPVIAGYSGARSPPSPPTSRVLRASREQPQHLRNQVSPRGSGYEVTGP